MNKDELKKIKTKTDGHNGDRFGKLLKKVVNVPKKEMLEREKKHQHKKETQ